MKLRSALILIAILLVSFLVSAQKKSVSSINDTDEYKVDLNKSNVIWRGNSIKGNHTGLLKIKSGSILFKNALPASGQLVVDMTTINCTSIPDGIINVQVVSTLKAADFFDVRRYPTATIDIEKFTLIEGTNYLTEGFITVKGVRQPISFSANISYDDDNFEGTALRVALLRNRFNIGVTAEMVTAEFQGQMDKAIDNNFELSVKIIASK